MAAAVSSLNAISQRDLAHPRSHVCIAPSLKKRGPSVVLIGHFRVTRFSSNLATQHDVYIFGVEFLTYLVGNAIRFGAPRSFAALRDHPVKELPFWGEALR